MEEKRLEIEDKVFQAVMNDIGKHYKVSDRLYDILSDSLSEHLPKSIDQAIAEEREKLRESVIKIHDEVGEEWSDAEYRSNYMSTLLISLQDNPKCVCGEQDIIGGAEVEIGGVCHRPKNPCYIIKPDNR